MSIAGSSRDTLRLSGEPHGPLQNSLSSLVPLCGVALKHSKLLFREPSLGPLLAYHVQLSERGAHLES